MNTPNDNEPADGPLARTLTAFCAERAPPAAARPLKSLALMLHASSVLAELVRMADIFSTEDCRRSEARMVRFGLDVAEGLNVSPEVLRGALRCAARDFYEFCSTEELRDGRRTS